MAQLTRQEFDKKFAIIQAQSELMFRICKARTVADLTKAIEAESKRITEETNTLNQQAKEAGII